MVLTDGENHEDDVVAASRAVATEGGSVHFIGVATLDGAPIPAFDSRGRPRDSAPMARDNLVSRLDESTLIEVHKQARTYTRASSGFVELSPLLQFKTDLEQSRISSVSYVDYEHQLMPWLILAAILLALESIVPRRPFDANTRRWPPWDFFCGRFIRCGGPNRRPQQLD